MPFAVIGSNAVVECQGKKVRGRAYPWGIVEGQFQKLIVGCMYLVIIQCCF